MFELKRINTALIPQALEKAKRYRLLNEPHEAESICRDIIAAEPGHQEALIWLLLALTDQFGTRRGKAIREARELVKELTDEYHRYYYSGLIEERRARQRFGLGGPHAGYAAYDELRAAMEAYEKAEAISPTDNDDAILRWNSCARMIMAHAEIEQAPAEMFARPATLE